MGILKEIWDFFREIKPDQRVGNQLEHQIKLYYIRPGNFQAWISRSHHDKSTNHPFFSSRWLLAISGHYDATVLHWMVCELRSRAQWNISFAISPIHYPPTPADSKGERAREEGTRDGTGGSRNEGQRQAWDACVLGAWWAWKLQWRSTLPIPHCLHCHAALGRRRLLVWKVWKFRSCCLELVSCPFRKWC